MLRGTHTIQKEEAVAILKKGLSGEPVRRLQAKLGVQADGTFGPGTEAALKEWQKSKGLAADGVAGPDTFMSMGLYELVLLKQGTRGDTVKTLQEKLGLPADGQFGPGTEKAIRDYQQKNGLSADGQAGPATLAQMKLFKEITPDVVKSSQTSAAPDLAGAAKAGADVGVRSIWDTIKSVFK
jgi:peptidoglycan hydrolase-like protein with peptidoglycan-binding domain